MPYYEREEKILNILFEHHTISNEELARRLFVSKPTLRRDLDKLEQKGLIKRTHGSCQLNQKAADEKIPFYFREQEQGSSKVKMAKKALEYIHNGDILMLDGSTSAYTIVPMLGSYENLIVITSGAKTSYLLGTMGIKNISTGGQMITGSLSYIGAEALHTINRYNADVVFFSCRGLSKDGYLTDNSIEENELRRQMLKHARKKILLCDHVKIGKKYLNTLCHVSELDAVISDTELPEYILKLMKEQSASS